MSGSGKGLLGLWLYHSGDKEWAVKEGSPLHKRQEVRITACMAKGGGVDGCQSFD